MTAQEDASSLRLVLCNCSSSQARSIAHELVSRRLAACVNIIPGITSVYRWQGEVCEDQECTLLIKTSASVYEQLESTLTQLHEYEVPEIISLVPQDVLQPYLTWALAQVVDTES